MACCRWVRGKQYITFPKSHPSESDTREHSNNTMLHLNLLEYHFTANPSTETNRLSPTQVSCLGASGSDRVLTVAKGEGMPLVLMSSTSGPDEVMKGIELGAVDFLETPVSQLKLRNIWQHVVRKVHSVLFPYHTTCATRKSRRCQNSMGPAPAQVLRTGRLHVWYCMHYTCTNILLRSCADDVRRTRARTQRQGGE